MKQANSGFYVGTAGWSFLRWDREFYPKGTSAALKLAAYAERFDTVEINNSFYHLPPPEQFAQWEAQAPPSFRFAVKAPRLITHTKKLKDAAETVPPLLAALAGMRHTAPVLFQLPPAFGPDLPRLEAFLGTLPPCGRYAIEMRHPGWHDEAVYRLLTSRNIAFVLFDTPEAVSPRRLTADFTYVRLRGREDTDYLKGWRDWLTSQEQDRFIFFNHPKEKSLSFGNALKFRELIETHQKC